VVAQAVRVTEFKNSVAEQVATWLELAEAVVALLPGHMELAEMAEMVEAAKVAVEAEVPEPMQPEPTELRAAVTMVALVALGP
jgi:hypothetical protein